MGHSKDDVAHKKFKWNENTLVEFAEIFGIGLFWSSL